MRSRAAEMVFSALLKDGIFDYSSDLVIKKCMWCGNEVTMRARGNAYTGRYKYQAYCPECKAHGPVSDNELDATNFWNRVAEKAGAGGDASKTADIRYKEYLDGGWDAVMTYPEYKAYEDFKQGKYGRGKVDGKDN